MTSAVSRLSVRVTRWRSDVRWIGPVGVTVRYYVAEFHVCLPGAETYRVLALAKGMSRRHARSRLVNEMERDGQYEAVASLRESGQL